jgi:putative peptide zinc metalloprotease protein
LLRRLPSTETFGRGTVSEVATGAAGLRFAPGVIHRASKRGLVIANRHGETVLFEHPRAAGLPLLLADTPTPAELAQRLGPPLEPGVISDLQAAEFLIEASDSPVAAAPARPPAVTLSRSGVMLTGIAGPSRWLDRYLAPVVTSRLGRCLLLLTAAAGAGCLAAGPPGRLSGASPATQVLLLLALGLLTSLIHELAHAVVLVHYGRTPRYAGFGLYWGAVSFYVDSTPALTLPRRARVVQALAGLAADAVTTSILAVLAQTRTGPLLAAVFWSRAVLNATAIALNALPVLEVDGHWALADYLDEPDLAPRARAALADRLHRRRPPAGIGLAAYGAISLLAGFALIAASVAIQWQVLGGLITALVTGSVTDILIGCYLVIPLAIAVFVSLAGLIWQAVAAPSHD